MTRRIDAHEILTVPNALSVLRIALIAPIVLFYTGGRSMASATFLVLSGLTDIADGWIARRWNVVSNVGKVLDPIADKLTLAAMLTMLLTSYPAMMLPLIILVIRETMMACTGIACVACTKEVRSARWHGKMSTLLLYGTGFAHMIWQEIPEQVSNSTIAICALAQLISLVLYIIDNIRCIRRIKGGI